MRTGGPEEEHAMTESRPGRIPVGDPIALRFDPETKHRLEQMAEGIGPRRFGALIRVACRRLVTQPKAVGTTLAEARRLSHVRRAVPLVMLTLKLEPATAQKFTALAAEHDTTISALMRIALHRFLEGRYKHPMLREAERPDCPRRSRSWSTRPAGNGSGASPADTGQAWAPHCSGSRYAACSMSPATSPRISRQSHRCAIFGPKSIPPG
jgi:predicted transcriptional regulator